MASEAGKPEEDVASLKLELEATREQLRLRQHRMLDLQRLLNQANQQVMKLSEQKGATAMRLQQFAQAAGQRDALAEELKSRGQQLEDARSQLMASLENSRALESNLNSLRRSWDEMQHQRSSFEHRLQERESEADTLRLRTKELERQVQALDALRAFQESRLQSYQGQEHDTARLPVLEKEVDLLRTQLAEAGEHNQALQQQLTALEKLASGQSTLQADLTETRETLLLRESELSNARMELQEAQEVAVRAAHQMRLYARIQQVLAHREEELTNARTIAHDLQRRVVRLLGLEHRLAAEEQEKTRLEAELAHTRDSLRQSEARLREKESNLSELSAALSESRQSSGESAQQLSQIAALEQRYREARQQLASVSSSLREAEGALGQRDLELRQALQSRADQVQQLQKQLSALEHAHSELDHSQAELQTARAEVEELRLQLEEWQAKWDERETRITRLAEVAAFARSAREELTRARELLHDRDGHIATLTRQLLVATRSQESSDAQVRELLTERKHLQEELALQAARLESLGELPATVENLKKAVQQRHAALQVAQAELVSLREQGSRVAAAGEKERELTQQLEEKDHQLRTLHGKAKGLIANLTEQNAALASHLREVQARYQELQKSATSAPALVVDDPELDWQLSFDPGLEWGEPEPVVWRRFVQPAVAIVGAARLHEIET